MTQEDPSRQERAGQAGVQAGTRKFVDLAARQRGNVCLLPKAGGEAVSLLSKHSTHFKDEETEAQELWLAW